MQCLSFGGCLGLPPGKHFLGSSVGIALFDLCYLDYNGAAEEDPFKTPAAHSIFPVGWASAF